MIKNKDKEETNQKYLIGWGHTVTLIWGGGPELAWHLGTG